MIIRITTKKTQDNNKGALRRLIALQVLSIFFVLYDRYFVFTDNQPRSGSTVFLLYTQKPSETTTTPAALRSAITCTSEEGSTARVPCRSTRVAKPADAASRAVAFTQ